MIYAFLERWRSRICKAGLSKTGRERTWDWDFDGLASLSIFQIVKATNATEYSNPSKTIKIVHRESVSSFREEHDMQFHLQTV